MKQSLTTKIAIGMLLGIISGWQFPEFSILLSPIGEMFMRLLKMLIVPLVLFSMTTGAISALKSGKSQAKKLALRTFGYYLLTTFFAVILGLFLVISMQPGQGLNIQPGQWLNSEGVNLIAETPDVVKNGTTVKELLYSFIPTNPIESLAQGKILPIIIFSLFLGFSIGLTGKKGESAANFFESMFEAVLKMTMWVIYLTPYGIFALIGNTIATRGLESLNFVMSYMIVVFLGLLIHSTITLPIIFLRTKRKIKDYLKTMGPALLNALSTGSSSATLPLTMNCVKKAKVSKNTRKFVLPLGATINMDGTALYEAVAVVFIAQAYNMNLDLSQIIIIALTATLASIGAAGIPQAGLVTMSLVLTAVGLPLEGVGLIIGVDWFLDRFRTAVNVWGDSIGAAVVDSTTK